MSVKKSKLMNWPAFLKTSKDISVPKAVFLIHFLTNDVEVLSQQTNPTFSVISVRFYCLSFTCKSNKNWIFVGKHFSHNIFGSYEKSTVTAFNVSLQCQCMTKHVRKRENEGNNH